MINIDEFFNKNEIKFETRKKGVQWIKNLKPESLCRVGKSYFAEEDELKELLESYLIKQIKTRKRLKPQRSYKAKNNFNKLPPSPLFASEKTTKTRIDQ